MNMLRVTNSCVGTHICRAYDNMHVGIGDLHDLIANLEQTSRVASR